MFQSKRKIVLILAAACFVGNLILAYYDIRLHSIIPITRNSSHNYKEHNNTYSISTEQRSRLYIHSANIKVTVAGNKTDRGKIIVSAWVHADIRNRTTKCCVSLNSGPKIIPVDGISTMPWFIIPNNRLSAIIYKCQIWFDPLTIKGVNIKLNNETCNSDDGYGVAPHIITSPEHRNIGVCGKIVYGNVDGNRLIEWFEFLNLVGVDKVVVTPYNITTELTRKVLSYYQRSGFVDVTRDFDFPEKHVIPRKVGDTVLQAYADERLALIDCTMRLVNYKYVAVFDPDEFMIPINIKPELSWKHFLDHQFNKTVAGLHFQIVYHEDSFEPLNGESQLFIGKHLLGTEPMFDRTKHIVMADRVFPESISTHDFQPYKNMKGVFLDHEVAVVHHYRKCRIEWHRLTKSIERREYFPKTCSTNGTVCSDLCRKPYHIVQTYADIIQDKVIETKRNLQN